MPPITPQLARRAPYIYSGPSWRRSDLAHSAGGGNSREPALSLARKRGRRLSSQSVSQGRFRAAPPPSELLRAPRHPSCPQPCFPPRADSLCRDPIGAPVLPLDPHLFDVGSKHVSDARGAPNP